jgi:hypothetical protein
MKHWLGNFTRICPGPACGALRTARPTGRISGSCLCGALLALCMGVSCGSSDHVAATGADPQVTTRGAVEVTARLVEIPEGAIFKRDLYDYATILKYQVLQVHRGQVQGDTIFVGHYDPWKPRGEAADRRIKGIGGNLRQFQAGQIHRLALDVPIEDHFMGGIVNKYFGRETGPLYWAVWTNLATE